MPSKTSPASASRSVPSCSSTRLENIRFADGRAAFEIDGQAIELAGEKAAPAIQAFQSFYQEAYRAYGTAPEAEEERRAAERGTAPSWWQRLRSWVARLFGAEDGGGMAPPRADSKMPRPTPPAEPVAAEAADKRAEARAKPAEVKADARPRRPSASVGNPPPLLMAAFADEQGVHLLWNLTPGDGKDHVKARSYGFQSPVAARLQDCYGKLSELGYDVVDLKVWQVAPEAAPAPAAGSPGPKPQPEKTERVVRLLPADSDHPTRVAVAPIEGDLTPKVFTETAKKVAALHAAADPAKPEAERLTFLRCQIEPKGLRVLQYAVGGDPAQAEAWKDIETLWADAENGPKATKRSPKPEAKPNGPHPELFPA